jgi:WD40 repeat protein
VTPKGFGTVLEGHETAITALSFSPDGTRLISRSIDNTIIIWNTKTYKPLKTIHNTDGVDWSRMSPDNKTLAVVLDNGLITLYKMETSKSIKMGEGE